ncbi:MAG: M60 family metallopeptidase, partial [Mucinivorans sp.]
NATCREVEFYKYNQENTLESSLAKVFTTTACMAVRAEATDKDIAALPEMFQNVAVAMRKGTYNPEFRMGTYKAFSSPEKWAGIFKSRKWGQADNPTGIWAKKGDEVVVCVGNVWGQHINLFSCDAYQGAWGDNYMLKSGVNKITILNDGLLYVKYYVDDLHNPDAKPIEVHFPEGSARVNGYWDVAQHKTNSEYERIMHLSKDPFHMFDIVGLYSHLIYPREFIPQYQIVKAFEWYDKMCWWDWEIMGLDKLYTQGIINHRHVFIAGDIPGKFMNASDYRTYYNQKTLMERLNEATMKRTRDLMWGPAHEMGHMHQYVFNFHGYTEASNNFFSNLFVYKSQWGFKSRGQGAQTLIDAGFAYQDQMINAGTDQKPEWNIYPRTPFLLLHRVPVQGTDIMLLARMNWQLYTYFHIAGKDTEFWPKYFELLRQGPSFGNSESEAAALNLYVMACEAAKLDLTDFFEAWGFFVPLDFTIYDYIEFHHCMTQEMIDAAKAQVKAKNYPKAGPIEYIEDRDVLDAEDQDRNFTKGDTGYWTYYRDNAKIKSNISVAVTANNFAVTNWEGAAAFEIWDLGVVKFKTVKKGFTVPTKFITPTSKLYAVQVDGQRIAIWPK